MGKGGNATTVSQRTAATTTASSDTADNSKLIPDKSSSTSISVDRKWYNRGGMHVNEIGMGINVALTPILLVTYLCPDEDTETPFFLHYSFPQVFSAILAFNIFTAVFLHRMKTVFCVAAVPIYISSLLNIFTLRSPVIPTLMLITAIAIWRVGICMSVCLHRYAAHAAFKCGPKMQIFLNILGCGAHQGGPIWWASQHRCHHKHCDLPRDPHSAIQVGTERAFAFFTELSSVEEEFAPKYNDNLTLRLIDTWSFVVASLDLLASYYMFGRDGLFISYSSMWLCQCMTLWFNIANHPPTAAPGKDCKAAGFRVRPEEWYPAFQLLHRLFTFFGPVVGESAHDDHHKHFMLAKRDSTDLAYYTFILPLKMMGLIWDVKETRLE